MAGDLGRKVSLRPGSVGDTQRDREAGQHYEAPRVDARMHSKGAEDSRMTYLSRNLLRAGLTGRLRAATLADMGRCRMGIRYR